MQSTKLLNWIKLKLSHTLTHRCLASIKLRALASSSAAAVKEPAAVSNYCQSSRSQEQRRKNRSLLLFISVTFLFRFILKLRLIQIVSNKMVSHGRRRQSRRFSFLKYVSEIKYFRGDDLALNCHLNKHCRESKSLSLCKYSRLQNDFEWWTKVTFCILSSTVKLLLKVPVLSPKTFLSINLKFWSPIFQCQHSKNILC
jgi:hypothetical protein